MDPNAYGTNCGKPVYPWSLSAIFHVKYTWRSPFWRQARVSLRRSCTLFCIAFKCRDLISLSNTTHQPPKWTWLERSLVFQFDRAVCVGYSLDGFRWLKTGNLATSAYSNDLQHWGFMLWKKIAKTNQRTNHSVENSRRLPSLIHLTLATQTDPMKPVKVRERLI